MHFLVIITNKSIALRIRGVQKIIIIANAQRISLDEGHSRECNSRECNSREFHSTLLIVEMTVLRIRFSKDGTKRVFLQVQVNKPYMLRCLMRLRQAIQLIVPYVIEEKHKNYFMLLLKLK